MVTRPARRAGPAAPVKSRARRQGPHPLLEGVELLGIARLEPYLLQAACVKENPASIDGQRLTSN
ncbi:hypothetical protein RA210_U50080 [Rubrivivax sp. A210]|nr:hypothetical protein RA210_U50080 [Rubrivivax sp. A210]